jgi:vacuolar-type H+-ATPase subunit E/Vma4
LLDAKFSPAKKAAPASPAANPNPEQANGKSIEDVNQTVDQIIQGLKTKVTGMQEERKKKEELLNAIEKKCDEYKDSIRPFSTRKSP